MARVATEEQNGSGMWKFAGESGSDSLEIANLRSSLHQYKNIVQKRQLSLPVTFTHTREL